MKTDTSSVLLNVQFATPSVPSILSEASAAKDPRLQLPATERL